MRRLTTLLVAAALAGSLSIAPGQVAPARAADTATLTLTTSGFVATHIFLFDYTQTYPDTALCVDCSSLSITVPIGTRMAAQVSSPFLFSLSCTGPEGPYWFSSDSKWYGRCGWTENVDLAADTSWSATFVGPDTTSPVLSDVPTDFETYATSVDGAVVTWMDPTASDVDDVATAPECTPASGSTFPLGATTVSCASSDTHGNTTTARFTVTVVWPTYQAAIDLTRQLVVRSGVAEQLVSYLDAARRAEARGNLKAEASNLESYRSLLRAQIGKSVTSDDAARLIGISTLL